jgi:hypothetical protein
VAKRAKQKQTNGTPLGIEATLWAAADKLPNNMDEQRPDFRRWGGLSMVSSTGSLTGVRTQKLTAKMTAKPSVKGGFGDTRRTRNRQIPSAK